MRRRDAGRRPVIRQILRMIQTLRQNARDHGVHLYDLDDPRQGIAHVVGPEEGLDVARFADQLR